MVKNDKHRTKALIGEDRKEIKISEELFNQITLFQDTIHNTAIEYHRKLRENQAIKSELDEIDGVGEKKRELLLKKFGTIDKIKNAKIEELITIKGINKELAQKIIEKLNKSKKS